MTRWLLRLLILVGVCCGLMLAVGLVAKSLVGGSGKAALLSSLGKAMGVPVSVESADFDLGQWFRLQPAISLENVSIGNPPGFRGKYLLEARKMSAQVLLMPLLQKKIEVHVIRVEQPRILVETNAQDVTNVQAFVRGLSTPSGSKAHGEAEAVSEQGRDAGLAIDALYVTAGRLVSPEAKASDIDLSLLDFSTDRTCRVAMTARLFGGGNSRLQVEGRAGPFAPDSLPLDGVLSATIAPGEIPAAEREKQFGKFLGAPGAKARVKLQATVKGDLYRTLSGPARLTLSDILIGKDAKHVLALAGEAPVAFSGAGLMSTPRYDIKITGGKLRLSQGEWSGDAEIQVHGATTSGHSRGKIRNVEINELVSSLTPANEKIYGLVEIPSYSLQFAGKNADEMLSSLNGSGKLSLTQGRIAALDLLASIQRALEQSQPETEGAKGSTAFATLTSDLNVGQSRLDVSGLVVDGPATHFTGKGTIGFNEALHFDLDVRVSGGVAGLVNRISHRDAQAEAIVPVVVQGTVNSPIVRPSVSKLATGVATGLIDSFLKKAIK